MKHKFSILKSLVIVFFILAKVSFGQIVKNDTNFKQLNTYFEKTRKQWNVPGMSIAIVKNDSVVFIRGYGVRNINKPDKVDAKTIFGIASNTKAFTAAALGILVDQGKISWDDKVIKYIPYFQLYNHYVTDEMTIRDLLSHRSGLKTFSGDLIWYASSYNRKEVIKRAKYLKPAYGFRTHFGYSNIMYLTAGEIVHVVTGKSWDDFIKDNFFIPLGMKLSNTSINTNNFIENRATPHTNVDSVQVPIKVINWDNMGPAGAINSNAIEMTKWIKLQLNKGTLNGRKYFSKKVSDEMWAPQTILRLTGFEKYYFPSMHFHDYGFGWEMFDYHGRKIVTHNGGLDGMISQVVLVPEENLGFVILTNCNTTLPYPLMYKILDYFFNEDNYDWCPLVLDIIKRNDKKDKEEEAIENKKRVLNTKPSLNLKDYSGTYGGKMYGDAKIYYKNNKLNIQFIPTKILNGTLYHWNYDTFKIKWNNYPSLPEGTVQFIIGTTGKVEEMRINVPNPDLDFTELKFFKKH